MRIAPLVIVFWAFAIAISMFQTTVDTDYLYNENVSQNNESDAVKEILLNPDQYARGDLFLVIFGLITAGGIIAIGLGAIMKSDMVLLGGMLTVLGGLIITPMRIIYSFLIDQFSQKMCPTMSLAQASSECTPALLGVTLILGTIAFMYVMACFEWWTSRQLTK